jgi:gluconate kinase
LSGGNKKKGGGGALDWLSMLQLMQSTCFTWLLRSQQMVVIFRSALKQVNANIVEMKQPLFHFIFVSL